jgi:pimeloyl-ACP methyl ester carboxylesterase
VALFGTSMGAAAILRAVAGADVRPDALVLECPFDRLLSTVANRCGSMHVPRFPTAELLVFWGGVQCGFNGFRHNPVDYARAVRCPALVLQGAADVRVTRGQATAIYEALPGDKQIATVEAAGHESFVSVNPDFWARCVGPFLGRHLGRPASLATGADRR